VSFIRDQSLSAANQTSHVSKPKGKPHREEKEREEMCGPNGEWKLINRTSLLSSPDGAVPFIWFRPDVWAGASWYLMALQARRSHYLYHIFPYCYLSFTLLLVAEEEDVCYKDVLRRKIPTVSASEKPSSAPLGRGNVGSLKVCDWKVAHWLAIQTLNSHRESQNFQHSLCLVSSVGM